MLYKRLSHAFALLPQKIHIDGHKKIYYYIKTIIEIMMGCVMKYTCILFLSLFVLVNQSNAIIVHVKTSDNIERIIESQVLASDTLDKAIALSSSVVDHVFTVDCTNEILRTILTIQQAHDYFCIEALSPEKLLLVLCACDDMTIDLSYDRWQAIFTKLAKFFGKSIAPDNALLIALSNKPFFNDILESLINKKSLSKSWIQIPFGDGSPTCLYACSHDGAHIATVNEHGVISIWNSHTGELVGKKSVCEVLDQKIMAIHFLPNGNLIAAVTTTNDATIAIYDVSERTPINIVGEHQGTILSTHFSDDGNMLVTVSNNGQVSVFDITRRQEPKTMIFQNALSAQLSSDGEQVAIVTTNHELKLWDINTGTIQEIEGTWCKTAQFLPDGKTIVITSEFNGVEIINVKNGERHCIIVQDGALNGASVSSDGILMATASDKGSFLWHVPSNTRETKLDLMHIASTQFLNDMRLLTMSKYGTVFVWQQKVPIGITHANSTGIQKLLVFKMMFYIQDPYADIYTDQIAQLFTTLPEDIQEAFIFEL